ncbi:uncharacterized protein LOC122033906 [Zingiber officinale]|uniref:uncharacterized protein LOC122033906 n=1 Tax=Zingiber officinale TaxID=94328 RepID=UPI001C4B415E|nr:uncharacterized protein LOC122033906 [Zingiber officinale]
MCEAAYDNYAENPEEFMKFLEESEKSLYNVCQRYTKLSALMKLYNTKARHGMGDPLFSDLLLDFGDMLSNNHNLPSSMKQYKNCVSCPKCGLSWWKLTKNKVEKKGVPAKVVWYFPPMPRFKRMFKSLETSRNLTWHADSTRVVGQLHHPVDSLSWKLVDYMWPDFESEPRNLRLALAADGINPHGNLSSRYSCWPIMLVNYNLPPNMCMKRKYIMLTMLISGPKQPGNDIDIYLEVLVEDLQQLWEGVDGVYDAYRREDTYARHLENGKKMSFAGHRRFLSWFHPYRRQMKEFNGMEELGEAARPLSRIKLFDKLSDIMCEFGKKISVRGTKKNAKANKLEVNKHLHVRHCLDVMHIEKNVFESLINTLMNVKGKAMDNVEARWMYLFETYMKVLKSYVGSRKHLEGCIVQRYLAEEAIGFCSEYLNDVDPIGVPQSIRDPKVNVSGLQACNTPIIVQQVDLQQAHLTVLENMEEVTPYIMKVQYSMDHKKQGVVVKENVVLYHCKTGKKAKIDYDDMGRPLYNTNGKTLQSYIGSIARIIVQINIKSWPNVPENIKQKLWEEISNVFELVPQSETVVMNLASQKWRDFKNKLTRRFVWPNKGNPEKLSSPPSQYLI